MRTFFLLIFLSLSISNYSQIIKTINAGAPGNLSTLLTEEEKGTITDLIVTGTIDARDFKCMRDQIANLKTLDLSNANIVAFDGVATFPTTYSYPANELPKLSFYNGISSKAKLTLTSVILPNSLTSIGQSAFYLCQNIKSIYIGNSVTTIGYESFKGCYGLATLVMGNSVTTIQDNAFQYCTSLKNITFSENTTTIGEDAFSDGGIEKVIVPKSLTTLNDAFRSNPYLTEVTLPASITSIANWSFEYCNSLKTIYSLNTIPPTCSTYSFYVMPGVTAVYVPASSVSAYKNAPVWGDCFYSQIQAMPTSGTTKLNVDAEKIYLSNSNIVIEKASKGDIIRVFSLSGQLVSALESSGDKISIPTLKNNIYIVKTAKSTTKISTH